MNAREPCCGTTPPDGEYSDAELAQQLKALADPARLAILRRLRRESEICACDLCACCSLTQPTVSYHLKVLREAELVTTRRQGQWIYYRLNAEALARLQLELP